MARTEDAGSNHVRGHVGLRVAATADNVLRGLQRLHGRDITHRIAHKDVESSQRLGRHRWTIERAMARLACCRRLHRRYERKADWHRLHEMAQRVADSPHVATT